MIRMVLFGIAFLGITIGLLVLQPGSGPRLSEPYSEPVTRAEPDMTMAPLPEPISETVVAELPETPAPVIVAPAPLPQRPAVVEPRPEPVIAMARELDDQSLRRLTWTTLSSLNQATGRDSAPGQPGSLLHTIVRRSLQDADATTAEQSGAEMQVYVVQEGDSLVSIAQRIYGDPNMTGPLFAANQGVLVRPDDLRPGQTLVLPRN